MNPNDSDYDQKNSSFASAAKGQRFESSRANHKIKNLQHCQLIVGPPAKRSTAVISHPSATALFEPKVQRQSRFVFEALEIRLAQVGNSSGEGGDFAKEARDLLRAADDCTNECRRMGLC